MSKGFIYILQSIKNGSYYIGSTKNLSRRLQYHRAGLSKTTKNLRPLQVVFFQKFDTLLDTKRIEHKLKKFKNRNIIKRIIKDKHIKLVGT